jgi:hypothetical protein
VTPDQLCWWLEGYGARCAAKAIRKLSTEDATALCTFMDTGSEPSQWRAVVLIVPDPAPEPVAAAVAAGAGGGGAVTIDRVWDTRVPVHGLLLAEDLNCRF